MYYGTLQVNTRRNRFIFFNDIDKDKTDLLQTKLPLDRNNFHVVVTPEDGNELLKKIGGQLNQHNHLHYFLLYDPYDASIDWEALFPFFRNWGEVMINHMVLDPVRAITSVKRTSTKIKYESTYLDAFENLVPFGSDKKAYEKWVEPRCRFKNYGICWMSIHSFHQKDIGLRSEMI